MLALPRRPNRQRIALGSSARLSQLHLGSSQRGLNALQCDASDGVICGRAALQRRLRGQSRKLSLPVMSRTEAASIEIDGGLANLGGGGLAGLGGGGLAGLGGGGLAGLGAGAPVDLDAAGDTDQDDRSRFAVGSPFHFRRRTQSNAAPAPASDSDSSPGPSAEDGGRGKAESVTGGEAEGSASPASSGETEGETPAAEERRQAEGRAAGGEEAEQGAGGGESTEAEQGAAGGQETEAEQGAGGGESTEAEQGAAGGQETEKAAQPADPELRKRVFAGNLPFTASKSRLWDLFEQFGKVANVHIVKVPQTGKSRGYGFVTFREDAGAQNALAADGSRALHLLHRQIRVSPAEPREARAPSARSRAGRAAAATARRHMLEPTGPCHVDRLPAELLQLVLSNLPLQQLLAAQQVSRRWRDAARDLLRRRHQLDLRSALLAPGGGGIGRLTDGTLRHLLRLMPALRVLRTGGNVRTCSYKALDIVATHCKHLVEIDLDGFCINEDSLKKLCIACPSLEEVRLPSHYHFSEASVWVLLRHLPALRTLELNSSDRVTGRCFSLLPDSLQRLSVAGCAGLRSNSLRQVGARCPQLRQLDVSGLSELHAGDLAAALAGCPQLERLTARRLLEPVEKYLPPTGLAALRHLDVGSAAGITDTTLRQLPDLLPGLHTLNIQGCPSVTEEGLYHVRRCKHLLSLDLSYLRCVSDAVLDKLHGLQLKQLHLAEGYAGPATFTDQGITRLVVGCSSLTLLDISCVEDLTPDLVDHLFRQLPSSRDVTLYVGGTLLQELPPPPPSGPLRLQDVNTVPLHMRGMIEDMVFGADDFDDYDYDGDDFDDYYGLEYGDFDFEDFHDPTYAFYDYGYEDVDIDEDGHLVIL